MIPYKAISDLYLNAKLYNIFHGLTTPSPPTPSHHLIYQAFVGIKLTVLADRAKNWTSRFHARSKIPNLSPW